MLSVCTLHYLVYERGHLFILVRPRILLIMHGHASAEVLYERYLPLLNGFM